MECALKSQIIKDSALHSNESSFTQNYFKSQFCRINSGNERDIGSKTRIRI